MMMDHDGPLVCSTLEHGAIWLLVSRILKHVSFTLPVDFHFLRYKMRDC